MAISKPNRARDPPPLFPKAKLRNPPNPASHDEPTPTHYRCRRRRWCGRPQPRDCSRASRDSRRSARGPRRDEVTAAQARRATRVDAPAAPGAGRARQGLQADGHAQRLDAAVEGRRRREGLPPRRRGGASTSSRPGLKAHCWGYNGRSTARPSRRSKATAFASTSPTSCPRRRPSTGTASSCRTAWTASAGLNQKAIQPGETFKYEFTLRQHGTLHVPLAPRRDDADGAGHDGHVRHPSAQARRGRARSRLRLSCSASGGSMLGTSRPDPNEMTDFNVLTHERQGVPRHRAAGRASTATACASASAISARWTITRSTCTATTSQVTETDGGRIPESRAVAGDDGARAGRAARARSSSSPTSPATGRCTAT